jgi:hypothetical protein
MMNRRFALIVVCLSLLAIRTYAQRVDAGAYTLQTATVDSINAGSTPER